MIKDNLSKLRDWSQRHFGVKPLTESTAPLEQWWEGPVGKAVLAEEQPLIDRSLRDIYGFHLMQLAVSRKLDLTGASTINHRFALSPARGLGAGQAAALYTGQADLERIPLGSETIDLAILHHVLDFSQHPHQLLRETARVVIPRGYVLIVGFNPFSWFGLFRQFGRVFSNKPQWRHHALRLGRVVDWLRLLDFEPVSIHHGFYRWPIAHPKLMERTLWIERLARATQLPVGGFYFILARKDVVGMIPIKPTWKKFNPIETLVGAQPSSRVVDPVRRPHLKAAERRLSGDHPHTQTRKQH
ncbi:MULTISPECIES: class I SAM-dependent methyltransferase [unclassified Gilvimarinus]|uniref:class I SAM-dependent methyltransferase n=1 Tax=Gilvimarinus sp. DZF01 TaxID=3461371 RepID=UPI004045D898